MANVAAAAALLVGALLAAPLALQLQAADTHLHMFLHDVISGSNPTSVQIIKGPTAASGGGLGFAFGDTSVVDDALTETSSATSAAVGRAQGFYMMSSQSGAVLMMCLNLVLTSGDYNGSTLAVIGRDDLAATVRELAVVGGTGKFRMATGYVVWKTSSMSGPDATIELDVYATTPNGTTIEASAPVSPLVGGGGTGSGSSGSSPPSSSGSSSRYGWVNSYAWVVAVVVVAVGGGW